MTDKKALERSDEYSGVRVNAAGHRSDWEFDTAGRLTRTVDADGVVSVWEWSDPAGVWVATGEGTGAELMYLVDVSRGFVSQVTDPVGGVTRFTFDRGLLTQVSGVSGAVTEVSSMDAMRDRTDQWTAPAIPAMNTPTDTGQPDGGCAWASPSHLPPQTADDDPIGGAPDSSHAGTEPSRHNREPTPPTNAHSLRCSPT
jgi:YD repeat-containing protein